ncbi:MAG: META domain-containing protein, partial [Candidatus Promineifilaceae bacterium]|nr:META domain-containing protein [Candidatus Promineifilaceae bacterium]
MKSVTRIILLSFLLILLAACQQEAAPEESIDLAGTNWVLSSLNGGLPVPNTAVTLGFGADGTASGSDGCNNFSTSYTQDGANLTINQPAATTMMACEEAVMNQASAYMTALADTTNFSSNGMQLNLLNGDQILATFVVDSGEQTGGGEPPVAPEEEMEPAADLAGTSWALSSLNGEPPVPDTSVFLQFGSDGTLSGSDGCNNFNTTYSQDGSSLTINPAGASTLMACPEPVMEQADAFNAALAATTDFVATEEELSLMAGDQVLATFELSSSDLAGTAWEVVSYNNGRDAVVSLLLGTQISAVFGPDGNLTGNAGCNGYFAGYTASEGSIAIGTVGSTMRFCTEPAGVMEQEAEYLAALESAATYSI